MKKLALVLAVASLFAGVAQAQTTNMNLGVQADIGTSGAGLHLSAAILPETLNARIGFTGLNYSYSGSTSDVNYDFKLKLETFDGLLDWFPSNGSFHVTTGIVHNGNKVVSVAHANSGNTYRINNNTYDASQVGTISGDVTFRAASPYLGIGWGNPASKTAGWGFASDLGLIFQGSPKSSLVSSGCTGSAQVCSQLISDLAVENTTLENKLHSFKTYPVARIGVFYNF